MDMKNLKATLYNVTAVEETATGRKIKEKARPYRYKHSDGSISQIKDVNIHQAINTAYKIQTEQHKIIAIAIHFESRDKIYKTCNQTKGCLLKILKNM